MNLTDNVRAFVFARRVHGTVTTNASAGTDAAYALRLVCTCGQHYYVFVTPEIVATTSSRRRRRTELMREGHPPLDPLRRPRLLPASRLADLPRGDGAEAMAVDVGWHRPRRRRDGTAGVCRQPSPARRRRLDRQLPLARDARR